MLGRPQDPTNDPQSPKITKHSINKTRGGLTDFHSMGKFAKPDQFPGMVRKSNTKARRLLNY